jgi:hypothetical protein
MHNSYVREAPPWLGDGNFSEVWLAWDGIEYSALSFIVAINSVLWCSESC